MQQATVQNAHVLLNRDLKSLSTPAPGTDDLQPHSIPRVSQPVPRRMPRHIRRRTRRRNSMNVLPRLNMGLSQHTTISPPPP